MPSGTDAPGTLEDRAPRARGRDDVAEELQRLADGVRSGSIKLTDLAYPLKNLLREVDRINDDASRFAKLPHPYERGRHAEFPIEVPDDRDVTLLHVFDRNAAEALYMSAVRGASMTLLMEEVLGIYEPSWRTQRRTYGVHPAHPDYGLLAAILPSTTRRREPEQNPEAESYLDAEAERVARGKTDEERDEEQHEERSESEDS
jgi:hypothetical protein